jgi:hypothetical protein
MVVGVVEPTGTTVGSSTPRSARRTRLVKPTAGVSPGVQAPIDTAARKPVIVH